MAKLTDEQKQAIVEAIESLSPYGILTVTIDSDTVARIETNPRVLWWINGKRIKRPKP